MKVAPAAQEEMRSTVFNLATRNPMALFGSDQVIDQFPGRKIYVGKKEGNKLENIMVFETDEESMPMKVTHARTGMLEADLPNQPHPDASLQCALLSSAMRGPYDLAPDA